jgi:GntR family transcriptional regulator
MKRQPQYHQTTVALEKLLSESEPGTFLPSEPSLAGQLGVSRATLREAMRTFEDRGWIVRRRGIGTYVSSPPNIIDYGLEVLESVDTLARRLGLDVEMQDLTQRKYSANQDQASIFNLEEGSLLLEVSRVILLDNRPAAFLIDVLPENILPGGQFDESFGGSVLDMLMEQRNLRFSKTEIRSVPIPDDVAAKIGVEKQTAVLRLEAYLFTKEWDAIDHSISYFLPGTFRFHVLRKVGLPAETD